MNKRCSACGEIKDVGEFSKCKAKKDGIRNQCKLCDNLYEESRKIEMNQYYRERRPDDIKLKEKQRKILSNMNKKQCNTCKEIKDISMFCKDKKGRNGIMSQCKSCQKEYYAKNKDKLNNWNKEYRKLNRDLILLKKKEYYHKIGKFIDRADRTEYRVLYRPILNRNRKERRKTDIQFKLKERLKNRLYCAIKREYKNKSALKLLGCNVDQLKRYLEDKFIEGMTWDNWSLKGWHIDHIRPCASFDLTDPEQQKQCFHYSNLQPLWAEDNLSKGAKYEDKIV